MWCPKTPCPWPARTTHLNPEQSSSSSQGLEGHQQGPRGVRVGSGWGLGRVHDGSTTGPRQVHGGSTAGPQRVHSRSTADLQQVQPFLSFERGCRVHPPWGEQGVRARAARTPRNSVEPSSPVLDRRRERWVRARPGHRGGLGQLPNLKSHQSPGPGTGMPPGRTYEGSEQDSGTDGEGRSGTQPGFAQVHLGVNWGWAGLRAEFCGQK